MGFNLLEAWLGGEGDRPQETVRVEQPESFSSQFSRVEIRSDVPGIGQAFVIGNPHEMGEKLDARQGDNELGYQQNCGLTSVANVATLCGMEVTEDDVVHLAHEENLCQQDFFIPRADRGGTNDAQIVRLLDHLGIEAHVEGPMGEAGSLEAIARYCENGQAVTMGVNAGMLWNEPAYVDSGCANHQITITGAARDVSTGEVTGLYICDSGTGGVDACRYVDRSTMEAAYTAAPGATIIVTDRAYA